MIPCPFCKIEKISNHDSIYVCVPCSIYFTVIQPPRIISPAINSQPIINSIVILYNQINYFTIFNELFDQPNFMFNFTFNELIFRMSTITSSKQLNLPFFNPLPLNISHLRSKLITYLAFS